MTLLCVLTVKRMSISIFRYPRFMECKLYIFGLCFSDSEGLVRAITVGFVAVLGRNIWQKQV